MMKVRRYNIIGDPNIVPLRGYTTPKQERQSTISTEVASFAYSPGTPTPLVGDAVHYDESDGAFYKADPLLRSNIVGVKDGVGNIVAGGIARGMSGLTAGEIYYLSYPTYSAAISQTSDNTAINMRYSSAAYARSQGFLGEAGKVVTQVDLKLYLNGTPSYDIYLELRGDDGTGKPSSTVLATSEHINTAALSTTATVFQFRFLNSYRLTAATYHIVVQVAESDVSITNYLLIRVDNANPYANGQMCVSDDADAWTAVSGTDLYFVIYLADVDGITTINLTSTHPFDHSQSMTYCYYPIWKIGRALSTTELYVSPVKLTTQILLEDNVTELSRASTTYRLIKFGEASPAGIEKLLILWRMYTTGGTAYAKPVWASQIGSEVTETANLYANIPNAESFSSSLNGRNVVAFWMKTSSGLVTGYLSYVTVLGV